MTQTEKRPARPASGRDVASAWLVAALLLLALALVSAFDAAVYEGVQAIAELH